ncbi:MAG: sorbosone dehydrogenase family protein [Alphaproteobacteria bacterium]
MLQNPIKLLLAGSLALVLAGCGDSSRLPEQQTHGANPTLPEPTTSILPTVNIAKATGWSEGEKPKAAEGLSVAAFATGLEHPRWVYVLPNGDVLVAESNAPQRPEEGKGIKGHIYQWAQKRAGAGVPSANRITLLRDADGDGKPETRTVFIKDLHSPVGMALVGDTFYVANADSIWKFHYDEGATSLSGGEKFVDLPGGPINHHWVKNIVASPDGTKLYASVGSNSNVGENGLDKEEGRAAIHEIDLKTGQQRIFAGGLRNANGMAWQGDTLWAVVNERDELGSDLVPDYLTSVKDGGFYGWPFSYYGQHVDTRVKEQRPDLVEKAIKPDYALGNHTASLGLTFSSGTLLPEQFRTGAFIGQHGSWNRKPHSGYKVIFVPFADGKPSGQPVDVLTGFLDDKDQARGRPVQVAIDKAGALLVADDVGNTVWRVSPATHTAASNGQ